MQFGCVHGVPPAVIAIPFTASRNTLTYRVDNAVEDCCNFGTQNAILWPHSERRNDAELLMFCEVISDDVQK